MDSDYGTVEEALENYREEADRILMDEKFSNLDQERFCIVTEEYGFLWNIKGGVFGVKSEDFYGAKEFYSEYGELEGEELENWYKKWVDSVLEVEDEDFVLLTDSKVGEYVDSVTELEEVDGDYEIRDTGKTGFMNKEVDEMLEDLRN